MFFVVVALSIYVGNVKKNYISNVQDKNPALNEAQKFFNACAQAWSLSTSSIKLVLRLRNNISEYFAPTCARK